MYSQDIAVMCNAVVLTIIAAVVLICIRSIAESLHQRARQRREEKRSLPSYPEFPPVRPTVVPPGPLWQNHRLWEDNQRSRGYGPESCPTPYEALPEITGNSTGEEPVKNRKGDTLRHFRSRERG